MLKKSIFDTQFALSGGLREETISAFPFFIRNRDYVLGPKDLQYAYQTSLRLDTAISALFNHLLQANQMAMLDDPSTIFAPLYIPKSENIPNILSTADFTIDLAQLPEGNRLKSISEYYNKIIINLTDLIRLQDANKQYNIVDLHAMHARYVRGALVASYQDSDGWLTPNLAIFIVKSYTLIVSDLIAQFYSLTVFEQRAIMPAIALYYCQALANLRDSPKSPSLFNRCTFIGNNTELKTALSQMESQSANGLTISEMCQFIVQAGPSRMANFSAQILYRMISNKGTSIPQMLIALEYPPYWVFQILLAISGIKSGMYNALKTNPLAPKLMEEAKRFAYELNISQAFIGKLSR